MSKDTEATAKSLTAQLVLQGYLVFEDDDEDGTEQYSITEKGRAEAMRVMQGLGAKALLVSIMMKEIIEHQV